MSLSELTAAEAVAQLRLKQRTGIATLESVYGSIQHLLITADRIQYGEDAEERIALSPKDLESLGVQVRRALESLK